MNETYVIGAGIVGVSCAIALQREGHQVVLLDREGPCAGASFGNAGAIVNGSCVPTATPGITGSAINMLLRGGPLSIRARSLPKLAPWLWRFSVQSREQHYRRNARNLAALTKNAGDSWDKLLQDSPLKNLLRQTGWMRVFETDQGFKDNTAARELMTQQGTGFELLDSEQIRQLEPGLAPIFKHGFLQSDCYFVVNPQAMVEGLMKEFCQRGGRFEIRSIDSLHGTDQGVILRSADEQITAAKVVLATGAHAHKLSASLGYKPPLAAERGYHVMLPPTSDLNRPVVHAEQGFVICPMQQGLRLTSQVELADVDASADYRYIRSLIPKAKRMLPTVETLEQSCWMGARPSLPDSQPIISKSTHRDVFYAFGHQHLGLTLGPLTGELIADLVADRASAIDLTPYRADRY